MLCPRCGTDLPENSSFCSACGNPVSQSNQMYQQPIKVKTYLVESILVTLLCCMPFGIIGIIFASKANSCVSINDINGAMEAANTAKNWVLAGFICGLVGALIYVGLGMIGVLAE